MQTKKIISKAGFTEEGNEYLEQTITLTNIYKLCVQENRNKEWFIYRKDGDDLVKTIGGPFKDKEKALIFISKYY